MEPENGALEDDVPPTPRQWFSGFLNQQPTLVERNATCVGWPPLEELDDRDANASNGRFDPSLHPWTFFPSPYYSYRMSDAEIFWSFEDRSTP